MIIFLYGQDTYRSRQKLKEIIEEYKKTHKSGLNFELFDAKETSFQDFFDKLKITSMFKEKKLSVLKNVFSDAKFKEDFYREIKNLIKSDDIVIVFEEGPVDQKNKLFKLLKKEAKCQEFSSLDGQKLKTWVKKEIEKHKRKIDPEALQKLIDFVGNDLWKMANEIKKLVNYKKDEIKPKDIELMVKPEIETDIFKTIEAISQKNKKQALKLLKEHLENGDSPSYLLSMINYQFRNLLVVKDLMEKRQTYPSILKKTGLHPFVVKKSYFQAEKFSFDDLKKIYQKIFETDIKIKTGKIEPEAGLELLIAKI